MNVCCFLAVRRAECCLSVRSSTIISSGETDLRRWDCCVMELTLVSSPPSSPSSSWPVSPQCSAVLARRQSPSPRTSPPLRVAAGPSTRCWSSWGSRRTQTSPTLSSGAGGLNVTRSDRASPSQLSSAWRGRPLLSLEWGSTESRSTAMLTTASWDCVCGYKKGEFLSAQCLCQIVRRTESFQWAYYFHTKLARQLVCITNIQTLKTLDKFDVVKTVYFK